MKVNIKNVWNIERTFEYDIPNADIKKQYKTLGNFEKMFNNEPLKIIKFLEKYDPIDVNDLEGEIVHDIKKVK